MRQAAAPAYEQVKTFVRRHIAQGQWKPGDPVPSEASLMVQFGISRMTANRALRELAAEGLVVRTQGSGTRVAELHRIASRLTIRDIHEEMIERGHRHTTRVVRVERSRACAEIAEGLAVRKGSTVFHTVLVHCADGVPVQREDRHVNPAAAPGYLEVDFSQTTPTSFLLMHAPLTEASYRLEALLPTADEAQDLQIRRSDPCLVMHRRTVSGPRVASMARIVYPGHRYFFVGQFAP